jgi:hypothetical protein
MKVLLCCRVSRCPCQGRGEMVRDAGMVPGPSLSRAAQLQVTGRAPPSMMHPACHVGPFPPPCHLHLREFTRTYALFTRIRAYSDYIDARGTLPASEHATGCSNKQGVGDTQCGVNHHPLLLPAAEANPSIIRLYYTAALPRLYFHPGTMSQEQRIVRVRRVDGDPGGFALVSAAAIGPDPLDLLLVATEGENAYRATSKPQMTSFLAPSPRSTPAPLPRTRPAPQSRASPRPRLICPSRPPLKRSSQLKKEMTITMK